MTLLHRWIFVRGLLAALGVITNAALGFANALNQAVDTPFIRNNAILGPIMLGLLCWNLILTHKSKRKSER